MPSLLAALLLIETPAAAFLHALPGICLAKSKHQSGANEAFSTAIRRWETPRPGRRRSLERLQESRESGTAIDIDAITAELENVAAQAKAELEAAPTLKDLEELRRTYLTKKGPIQAVMAQMRYLSDVDKPKLGKVSNAVKELLESTLEARRDAIETADIEARIAEEAIDVTLPGRHSWPRRKGHRHPLSIMMELATDIFVDLGYDLVDGVIDAPEIENDYYCFEALNCPPDHPAREMQDTFYIEQKAPGVAPLLLRTQTSAVQIRQLEKVGPPLAIVSPGRVYRRDTPDATHYPEFHQVEILRLEEKGKLTLGHLKGTVDAFLRKLFGPDIQTRYRGSYFPFTEPSMEVDVFFKGRWMEVLGCGMVDERVLELAGVDPDKYSGFAAGFGVERFAMVLFGIPDLRMFWDSDIRFLEQFPEDITMMKAAIREGSLATALEGAAAAAAVAEQQGGDDGACAAVE